MDADKSYYEDCGVFKENVVRHSSTEASWYEEQSDIMAVTYHPHSRKCFCRRSGSHCRIS